MGWTAPRTGKPRTGERQLKNRPNSFLHFFGKNPFHVFLELFPEFGWKASGCGWNVAAARGVRNAPHGIFHKLVHFDFEVLPSRREITSVVAALGQYDCSVRLFLAYRVY